MTEAATHTDPLHCVCGGDSEVFETRHQPEYVRRRRACKDCGVRWTTRETLAPPPKPSKRWLREQSLIQEVTDRVLDALRERPVDAG